MGYFFVYIIGGVVIFGAIYFLWISLSSESDLSSTSPTPNLNSSNLTIPETSKSKLDLINEELKKLIGGWRKDQSYKDGKRYWS